MNEKLPLWLIVLPWPVLRMALLCEAYDGLPIPIRKDFLKSLGIPKETTRRLRYGFLPEPDKPSRYMYRIKPFYRDGNRLKVDWEKLKEYAREIAKARGLDLQVLGLEDSQET